MTEIQEEYSNWVIWEEPFNLIRDGYNLTVYGEKSNINTGCRQHIIKEETIMDYSNADWFQCEIVDGKVILK